MSARTEVLLWARRIVAKRGAPAYQLLEISAGDGADVAQEAFHKIARIAHPDLHRTTLTSEELELVTTAYSYVAGAYQEVRSQRMQTTRMRPIKDDPPPVTPPKRPSKPTATQPDPTASTAVPPSASAAPTAALAMNSKALLYYRKAELSLRRGDLKTAILQIKMAIAGDPQSTFLRSALAEIEAEIAKA